MTRESKINRLLAYSGLAVLALGTLALIVYVFKAQPEGYWTVAAAGIQALATVGLVWVTVQYAGLVEDQARAARDSAEAAQQSAEATQLLARLQTREARQKTVTLLEELKSKLEYLKSCLEDWKHNSPSWQKLRDGAEPSRLQFADEDIKKARTLIAGLAVQDETQRKQLGKVIDQLDLFRNRVNELRGKDRAVGLANQLEEQFTGLQEKIEESLMIVRNVRQVLL